MKHESRYLSDVGNPYRLHHRRQRLESLVDTARTQAMIAEAAMAAGGIERAALLRQRARGAGKHGRAK